MAYARGLIAAIPDRLAFSAVHPNGLYGRLNRAAVNRFLDRTEAAWRAEGHALGWRQWLRTMRTLVSLHPRRIPSTHGEARRIYVQASPHHLERSGRVASILRRENARLVCLVHDLIPIEYPEYARAGGAEIHRRRIATISALADGIITNSAATSRSLEPFLAAAGRQPLVRVAHLGIADAGPPAMVSDPRRDGSPYFVCIGTIEPRKNHLLLLNLWRRMASDPGGEAIPKLVLIGRRGWENEQIIDMLDRCPALKGHVEEHGRLPDRDMLQLLAGAKALLMPSFAEGYGMPVTEALAVGTPVICSDLPALREAGGDAAIYLDPLDGPAWLSAIRTATARDRGHRHAASPLPMWPEHIAIVLDLMHRLAG